MVELGVCDGHVARYVARGLVVVRDADVYALREHPGDFVCTRDAAVYRHDEIGFAAHAALHGCLRERIALVVAVRDDAAHVCAQRAQAAYRDGRSRDAVYVEVAEDEDAAAAADDLLDLVRDLCQAGDELGVEPIAIERGREEELGCLGCGDAARNKDAAGERPQAAVDLYGPHRIFVDLWNVVCLLLCLFHAQDCPTKL